MKEAIRRIKSRISSACSSTGRVFVSRLCRCCVNWTRNDARARTNSTWPGKQSPHPSHGAGAKRRRCWVRLTDAEDQESVRVRLRAAVGASSSKSPASSSTESKWRISRPCRLTSPAARGACSSSGTRAHTEAGTQTATGARPGASVRCGYNKAGRVGSAE